MLRRLLTQTTRALAGEKDVDVTFGGETPRIVDGRAQLPAPPRQLDLSRLAVSRGHADAAALRLAHHDPGLHARLAPQNEAGRALHAALEDVRLEAIGGRALRGVGDNLAAALDRRLEDQGFRRIEDRQQAPLPDVIALLARECVTGRDVPEPGRKLVEAFREEISLRGGAALAALENPAALDDQAMFAALARKLIEDLGMGDGRAGAPEDENSNETQDTEENSPNTEDERSEGDGPDAEDDGSVPEFGEVAADDKNPEVSSADSDDSPAPAEEDPMRPGAGRPANSTDSGERYRPYTVEYDEVASAATLADAEELQRLRQSLDQQLGPLHALISRLANRLHRRLLAQQNRSWNFDLDEGILDAARLARVIADPMQPLSFKQEKDVAFRDTTVTLLIDNSGSMRGRPITVAALCADILARTLERCGVNVEILGFTTRAWKGGRAREKWIADGRPRHPGRLNDLRHIIYKAANVPWRRAKVSLGLMLKEGLLKENIDGEALAWAHERLLARPEARRILMVISDGAPVDDTTSSNNGGGYLERHLRDVIAEIEMRSPVELIAIGIGHDVTRFYSRALTITDIDQLGGAMTEQLAGLFEESPRRGRAA